MDEVGREEGNRMVERGGEEVIVSNSSLSSGYHITC